MGPGEVAVEASELFSSSELLVGRMATERMLGEVSTRRVPAALEPVGAAVEQDATREQQVGGVTDVRGDDRDAVADLLAEDLSGLDLAAIVIDGVHWPTTESRLIMPPAQPLAECRCPVCGQ